MKHWALGAMLLGAILGVSGCTFTRISFDNIGPFFSTPDPAPRQDAPGIPDAAVAVLWVGHATTLVQIYDKYVLTDPVFTETVGTLSRRLVAPGLAADALPPVTVTLISHRHFDHLSRDSFELIGDNLDHVFVPSKTRDDIPDGPYEVHELAWGEYAEIDGMRITAVRVVHEGGRVMDEDSHPESFTGYVMQYRDRTVYFAGDTAYGSEVFAATHALFPQIDLALLPICPMAPADVMLTHHMDPEQALLAMNDLDARHMVPIHFATFVNSYDKPGDCEQAFDAAVRATGSEDRVTRLLVGENRRIIGLPSP